MRTPAGTRTRRRARTAAAAALLAPTLLAAPPAPALPAAEAESPRRAVEEGASLVGEPLPDWGDLRFLEPPHRRRPERFRGRVLLIRFWTGSCPFCETSAPVLSEWAKRYEEAGLTVLGIYHPKPPRAVETAEVRRTAKALGLRTLLAVDDDWSALRRLWLVPGERRSFTSASLLVDRKGVVRAVHVGGNLTPEGSERERRAHDRFAAALERLLDEPAPEPEPDGAER